MVVTSYKQFPWLPDGVLEFELDLPRLFTGQVDFLNGDTYF